MSLATLAPLPAALARALRRLAAIPPIALLWGYLGLITLAEVLVAIWNPSLGMLAHTIILVLLTIHGALGRQQTFRRLALALTLAPLTRLLSLGMPLKDIPQLAWYPIIAVPLMIATWLVVRQLRVPRAALGLRAGNPLLQLMLVGCGMMLGYAEYLILKPPTLIGTFSWNTFAIAALTLTVSTGFVEEIIFRGVLQAVALPALGRWALVYVSLLFAALHIGYLSLTDVLFVFSVGLLFAYTAHWGGSIVGVSLAHGLTNVTMFLIVPYITQHPTSALATAAPWLMWGGIVLAMVAFDVLLLRFVVLKATVVRAPGVSQQSIRALRHNLGLAYIDMAERTGLPVRLLAEIEHGLRIPQAEQLAKIAQGLGVAPQSLGATI